MRSHGTYFPHRPYPTALLRATKYVQKKVLKAIFSKFSVTSPRKPEAQRFTNPYPTTLLRATKYVQKKF
jgi:hypothetical protein